MKICVTSKSFSRSNYLREKLLSLFPNTKFNDEMKTFDDDSLVDFLMDCNYAIIGLEKINSHVLKKLPTLKGISKFGVGLDNISLSDLKTFGVNFSFEPGVNKRSVAELALFSILGLLRGSFHMISNVRNCHWSQVEGSSIQGKTIGIVGLGNIGTELINLLKPFDVNIVACDIEDRANYCEENNILFESIEKVFEKSDVVSLHIPLDENNSGLINKNLLKKMKKNSFIVNTSRGGVIVEQDLITALTRKEIAGAFFDTFSDEPNLNENLVKLNNFWGTPHIGGSTSQAIALMGESAINGIQKLIDTKLL